MSSQLIAGAIQCVLCDCTGRGLRQLAGGWLLQTSPHMPVPLAALILYPLTVVTHSHEGSYMLSPRVLLVDYQPGLFSETSNSEKYKNNTPLGAQRG